MKHIGILVSAIMFLGFLFVTGCATSPSGDGAAAAREAAAAALSGKSPGSGSSAKSDGSAPAWIDSFPADDAYYIGIGSSDTGNKSNDMELARAKALTALAASISTYIQSQSTIVERGDSEGNRYEAAENIISETVNQNLKMVEVVDSYHSAEIGYWFYVRLNKTEWAEIQRREIADLNRRVLNLVEPVLESPSSTAADKLTVLAKGWMLIMESPYAGLIDSELLGKSGKLIDLVERNIAVIVNTMRMIVTPANVAAEVGRPADLSVSVAVSTGGSGQLSIDIVRKNGNVPFTSLTTDQDGVFSGKVDTAGLPPGKTSLTARLDVRPFGIEPDSLRTSLLLPERDFSIDIQQIKAGLRVTSAEGIGANDLYVQVEALLAKMLPFKIGRPSNDDRFILGFTLLFTDYPENDFGLLISEAKGIITVERDGRTLFSVETPNQKAGGLNRKQAHDKSFEALMKYLDKESGLAEDISGVLSYE